MQNLQDIFNRIRATKREQKQITAMYKDALEASNEYREVLEKLRGYKLRKQQIEEDIKADLGNDLAKLESLKKDAQTDRELMADLAINHLIEGKSIKVEDEDRNEYEPVFSLKFKKTNVIRQDS